VSASPYGTTRPDLRTPRAPATLVSRCRMGLAIALSTIVMGVGSLVLLLVGIVTLFQARRLYAEVIVRGMSRIALWLFGVKLVVHRDADLPTVQTVFISNHTSTLDMFVIIALGLPNSRYFLSGFLRKILPLWFIGWMIGVFWTALQKFPERRTQIFQNAEQLLRGTGESVFLTPEGQVTGVFNKGAFHLATNLRAPIVPIYIHIANEVDPGPWFGGDGLAIRSGAVHVYFGPPIETTQWQLVDLDANRNRIRDMYTNWQQELNQASA
jgi:1-acyl-sn-glycerol-3-phosphate acyltransferase